MPITAVSWFKGGAQARCIGKSSYYIIIGLQKMF